MSDLDGGNDRDQAPDGAARVLIVSLVALLSGAAAMVYQINWQRELTTILGTSHYATTTVVFAFFLGFALGAWLARTRVDRVGRIFLAIVLLEGTIGAYAWFSPLVFQNLRALAPVVTPPLEEFSLSTVLIRALLSTTSLILPTVCMGATLPFFFKAGILVQRGRGSRIGLITGLNTTGAVLGAIVTTFLLMGVLTSTTQLRIASALNFTAALVAATFIRRAHAQGPAVPAPAAAAPVEAGHVDRRIIFAYAMTGAAGLALEIVWNRLAYMSLQHTIYTFALTLSMYLLAYALGALVGGLLLRRFEPSRNRVAALLVASVLSTVAGFLAFRSGLSWVDLVRGTSYLPAATLIVAIYVFLPTFFMGIAMPMVLQLLTRDMARLGRDTSQAQAVNNLGSLTAIFLVGFVLIPLTNLWLVSVFCLALLVAAVVVLFDPSPRLPLPAPAARALAVAVGIGAVLALPTDLHRGLKERFYSGGIWYEEDEMGFWGVARDGNYFVLLLDGYYEAALRDPPRGTQEGDFLIPAMAKPGIRTAYMVGLGYGMGSYELLRLADVERFDVAEISPASIELSHRTWEYLDGPLFRDPRFRVFYEDGRIFLRHSQEAYDLIVSGTNRSFYPGSTHLYSKEYWEMVREKLAPGGLFFQWLPTYSEFSSIVLLKTFLRVFPDTLIVRYPGRITNYFMLGFRDGIPEDWEEQVRQAYRRAPEVLSTSHLPRPDVFFDNVFVPRRRRIGKIAVPLNRDDFPVVEYSFRGYESEEKTNVILNFPLETLTRPYRHPDS